MPIRLDGFDRFTRKLTSIDIGKLKRDAVNNLAFEIKRREEQEIARRIHQPGTLIKKGVRVDKASTGNPTATIRLAPKVDELLDQQFTDVGRRKLKIYERLMLRAGVLRAGEYTIPAAGAKINPDGNQARSEIVEILTLLKLRKPRATKAKRRRGPPPGRLFLADGTRGLKRGIWRQMGPGKVVPVMLFVKQAPRYRKAVPFVEIAKDEIRRKWRACVDEAFQHQLRKAGL